ncbi:MAG: DUF3313 family protein [Pseudomonadota bacterium]|jgi:hypothetical protein|nr:DUF3313 family protein [Pseudomonadota bacterium]
MRDRLSTIILSAIAGLVFFWHAGESNAQPVLAVGPNAEVTEDGLHKLDPFIMGAAWVKPDLDLSQYRQIFLLPSVVQFRDIPERNWTTVRTMEKTAVFPPTETMKARLRDVFSETFAETIEGVGAYRQTDELGRDVLMVRGFLTDVISGVPPDIPGSIVTTIAWVWEANIVLELRDAMSDEVLARTVERQRMDADGVPAGLVMALTPRVVNMWTQRLLARFYQLSSLDSTRPRPL